MKPGTFKMRTTEDLFAKMQRDLQRMRDEPLDPHPHFDFFVTAEHMPEWFHNADENRAKAMKQEHWLLRACSHLATGSKHLRPKDNRWRNIVHGTFIAQYSITGELPQERFWIEIREEDVVEAGRRKIDAISLAEQLVDYWRNELTRP